MKCPEQNTMEVLLMQTISPGSDTQCSLVARLLMYVSSAPFIDQLS